MKIIILAIFLLFPIFSFSQTISEMFLQIPNDVLKISNDQRKDKISEVKDDLLKFNLSESMKGEVKIITRKKDEVLLGMSVNDCDQSDLRFWKVKKNNWKDVTKDIIKPIGKDDIVNILQVSPVTLSKSNQELGITYFYRFSSDSLNLQLIARKQDSCEIAGTVYNYNFNGKKYGISK